MSADETADFSTPYGPDSYQLGFDGDWVVGNKRIRGITKSGVLKSDHLAWDEVHGATKSASIFKKLEDLVTVATKSFVDKFNRVTKFSTVTPETTKNDRYHFDWGWS